MRLDEAAKEQRHHFEMQQARLASEFQEKQARLKQALKMKELEVEQQAKQLDLQKQLHEMEGRYVQLSSTVQAGQLAYKDMQIGSWLEGVRPATEVTNVRDPLNRDPNDPGYVNVTQGLAESGATLLTEMGLDQNTTQFITAQAACARSKTVSRGPSATRGFGNVEQSTIVTGTRIGSPQCRA